MLDGGGAGAGAVGATAEHSWAFSSAFIADGTNMSNIFYDVWFCACGGTKGCVFFSSRASRIIHLDKMDFTCPDVLRTKGSPGNWFHKTVSTILSLLKSQFSGQLGNATLVFVRRINALKNNTRERLSVLVNSYMHFSKNVNAVNDKNYKNHGASFKLWTFKCWQLVFNS